MEPSSRRDSAAAELARGFRLCATADAAMDKSRRERDRLARVARAKDDPRFFCSYYLAHYFRHPETGEPTDLADWQGEVIDLTRNHKSIAIAAPRGHGKTTFLALALTLRDLLVGASKFTIYLGPTAKSARDRITEIRLELETNERILEDFGDLLRKEDRHGNRKKAGRQASDDLQLSNGARVLARGAGEGLRGSRSRENRPDRVIGDDLDRDGEVANPDLVEKKVRWFKRAVLGLQGAAQMSVIVVGNVIARKTFLTAVMAMSGFVSRIYRALKADGTPLMPALFSVDRLEEIRESVGTDAFQTEYMNDPPAEGNRPFREEWLQKRWDDARLEREDVEPGIIVSLDLSKGKTERSDFQAMVAVRRDAAGAVYILKVALVRLTRRELAAFLFRFCEVLGLDRIVALVIESNGFQEWFAEEFAEASSAAGYDLPIVQQSHSLPKYDRIMRLAPIAEGGRLYFPPHDDEGTKLVRRQLEAFPDDRHDDGPDALAMAVEESARRVRDAAATRLDYSIYDRDSYRP
jgi:predicted phage terminase large subunit-like protein